MKKIIRYIAIMIGVVVVLTSCEKEINIDYNTSTDRITINALVSPDTVVTAFITAADRIDYFSSIVDRANYYDYDEIDLPRKYMKYDTIFMNSIIPDATVTLTVNGQTYPMEYNPESYTYDSNFTPQVGDEIRIDVDANWNDSVAYDHAYAVTTLLPAPTIEVIGKELKIKKKSSYSASTDTDRGWIDDYWGDSIVMVVKLKLIDPGDENNFYRLKVRSVGASLKYVGGGGELGRWSVVDLFTSYDNIFHDNNLYKPYGYIPAYFSNVFDDGLCEGKEYEFEIETRMRRESDIPPYAIIELQHLSSDLFHFLKNIEQFRISDFDLYDNPIRIHNNVQDGWGIFAAINFDTHIVYFQD